MDELLIRSKFMQDILAKVIRNVIQKKIGVNVPINFLDPISITFDGQKAKIHLDIDAEIKSDEMVLLLSDFI